MTITKPHEMGQSERQGKPQRMGMPYSLSPSLSLLPDVFSSSIDSHQSSRGPAVAWMGGAR